MKSVQTRSKGTRRVMLGDREIVSHGLGYSLLQDFYHTCMVVSWPVFFLSFAAVFLGFNTVFSIVYWLGDNAVANIRPGYPIDYFFFSIETLATVGYGNMYPQTTYGHVVATIEILVGIASLAVMTGLVFARFSRPRAQILFSNVLAISNHDGVPALMLRVANARHNFISDATAELWFTRHEVTAEGERFRRFHPLHLARDQNPLFALSWTLIHTIDESSLLFGLDAAALADVDAGFIVTLSGHDDTSAQAVHVRRSYTHTDMRWGERFADIIFPDGANRVIIDFRVFHKTLPVTKE